ncbi:MAG: O-antigen ligase family protein [Tannerella sp.]|jgi:tetratricopeptide (TPR) repeat protein|nr:O-antigen ligase family protein [Tannerella sp.]
MKKNDFKTLLPVLPFFMILGTVFVVRPELGDGIVSGKYFHFYLSMGLVASTCLVCSLTMRKSAGLRAAMPCRGTDRMIALFAVSTLSASCLLHSSGAATKHVLLLLVVLLYFYFKWILNVAKPNGSRLLLFFLATGLVESLWGLRQLYGFEYSQHAHFRLTGSFFNPGPYACYLATVMPAALWYLLRGRRCTAVRFRRRYLPLYVRGAMALLTCVGIALVLPATMSRTSWLAAAGGCGMVFCAVFGRQILGRATARPFLRLSDRRFVCIIIAAILVIPAGIGMYRMKKDSADGRALMWKIALQTAVRHPMGVGIGHFSGSYGCMQAEYFASGQGTEQERRVAGNPEYGFNEYLQIAVEQGVVPLALFLGIMGYSLYAGIRRRRIAATASLLALLIAALASYPFSVLPFPIVLAYLLADIHARIGKRAAPAPLRRPALRMFGRPLVRACAGLLLTAACLYDRYPTYEAYRQWGRSRTLYHAGAYEQASEAYAPLCPLLSDRLTFLFEYAQSLSRTARHDESNRILQKAVRIGCDPMLYNVMGKNHQAMKCYAEAERCFLRAAHIVPNRIYPWYLLAGLYVETGDTAKARDAARIVLVKEPKVQSTAVREMREKMKALIDDAAMQ